MITEAEAPITGLENQLGLTKREYFATNAMKAFLEIQYGSFESACKAAVECADFLIIELNKPTVSQKVIKDDNSEPDPF